MSKPIIAVVGRPNVGKSTFFNKIVGSRVSIVEDTPGVTRDRIIAEAEWTGRHFMLIDTGGIEPENKGIIPSQMRAQAELAMDMADVILFMVDGRGGVTAADREVADMLRRKNKDVILVANKIDNRNLPEDFYDFYELGLGEPFAISSTNQLGLGDLLDEKEVDPYRDSFDEKGFREVFQRRFKDQFRGRGKDIRPVLETGKRGPEIRYQGYQACNDDNDDRDDAPDPSQVGFFLYHTCLLLNDVLYLLTGGKIEEDRRCKFTDQIDDHDDRGAVADVPVQEVDTVAEGRHGLCRVAGTADGGDPDDVEDLVYVSEPEQEGCNEDRLQARKRHPLKDLPARRPVHCRRFQRC